jgi:predicted Zn-dependent protease
MRAWQIACAALMACLAAQGCSSGSTFILPVVSQDEAQVAAHEVDVDPRLPQFRRSGAYYKAAIERIDAALTAHVEGLCVRAGTEDCRFRFHYVGDGEVNAYTDENGDIYLHRGILDYLEPDEEIAAVMAHEMGHQIAGHVAASKRRAIFGALIGGLLMGGAAVAGNTTQEEADRMAAEGMSLGARVGILTFSKEQEREADLLAVYVLARGGVDLDRAGGAYDVLAKLDDQVVAGWNDDHPAGPERIVAWRKAVAEVKASRDELPMLAKP